MSLQIVQDPEKWREHLQETNAARIIERAALDNFPISRAIISILRQKTSVKVADLHKAVCERVGAPLPERFFQKAMDFTNEKLRLINNLDPKHEVCIARIYFLTVEVEGKYFRRVALVDNL